VFHEGFAAVVALVDVLVVRADLDRGNFNTLADGSALLARERPAGIANTDDGWVIGLVDERKVTSGDGGVLCRDGDLMLLLGGIGNQVRHRIRVVAIPTAGLGSAADWQPACGLIQAGQWYHVVGQHPLPQALRVQTDM
jgi:hypothetical protein